MADWSAREPFCINEQAEAWVEEDEEKLRFCHPGLSLFLDLNTREGKVRLAQPRAWQDVLRITYFHLLLEQRGLLVHASGLLRRQKAWVFPGPSGAGKTTIVRCSPGLRLLSDEIVALQLADDGPGVMALGTPFYGEWGQPGEQIAAPLAGLYFPRQAKENRLVPLTPREVLTRLLPCVCTFSAWPSRLQKIFDSTSELVARVPGYDLHFRPEPELWQAINGF